MPSTSRRSAGSSRYTDALWQTLGSRLSSIPRLHWLLLLILLPWQQTNAAEPDVETFFTGIAHLRAKVPEAASSADKLGTERQGTAIVIGGDGLLVTVGYLVLHASEVLLHFQSGAVVEAQVVAQDPASGLALLRAKLPDGTLALATGRSDQLEIGQRLIAIDHRGRDYAGAVELVEIEPFNGAHEFYLEHSLRTAPLRRHFSGAALIDRDSRLLGIGAFGLGQISNKNPQAGAGNLFIPIERLMVAIADMLVYGYASTSNRPWIGISITAEDGLVVTDTHPHGPARAAGIMAGDELIAIDNYRIHDPADFYHRFWQDVSIGQSATLLLARERQLFDAQVTTINALEQLECKAC